MWKQNIDVGRSEARFTYIHFGSLLRLIVYFYLYQFISEAAVSPDLF